MAIVQDHVESGETTFEQDIDTWTTELKDPDAESGEPVVFTEESLNRELVGAIAGDDEIANTVRGWVKPSNFQVKAQAAIVGIVFDHLEQYGSRPSREIILNGIKQQFQGPKGLAALVEANVCLEPFQPGMNSRKWLTDQCREVAKRSAVKKLCSDAIDDMKKGKLDFDQWLAKGREFSERLKTGHSTETLLQPWSEVRKLAAESKPVWIVPGWIKLGGLHLFTGLAFAGKSCVIADIVAAIAHETDWATIPTKRCPVVLVDLENDVAILNRRVERALTALGGDGDIQQTVFRFNSASRRGPIGVDLFAEIANQFPGVPGIIIADTLRSCRAEDPNFQENDNSCLSKTLKPWRDFCKASGWGVLVLHHKNKQGGYSGGTALPSNADIMFSWTSDKKTGEACLEMDGSTYDHQEALNFVFDKDKGRNVFVGKTSQIKQQQLLEKRRDEQAQWLRLLPRDEANAETWQTIGERMIEAGLATTNNASIRAKLQTGVNDALCGIKGKGVKGDPTLYWLSDKGLGVIVQHDAQQRLG